MEQIILPAGVSLGVIAFLLSLLPAGFFIWLWYLRRHDRTTPAGSIATAFLLGLATVIPAFQLESIAERVWAVASPATAHYFAGAVLPLQGIEDIVLPALATFLIVATIEEGLRYIILRLWINFSKTIDQIFDGLLIGVAVGLGFATLENTVYFLGLFQQGSYDTLVFVFFLRFLISTIAHVSFGGIMGTLIARGQFGLFHTRPLFTAAFFIPWFLHGLFDLLLGIGFSLYAVVILLPALLVLVYWSKRREYLVVHRMDGAMLLSGQSPQDKKMQAAKKLLQTPDSPWNKGAPWLSQTKHYQRIMEATKHDQA